MKLALIVSFTFFVMSAFAQFTEFASAQNGLIYSDTTVKQLKHIVDSLNLKFKVCELNKRYLSESQGRGHHIVLAKGDLLAAKADLEQNISPEKFLLKYRNSEIDRDLLIVKFTDEYHGKRRTIFSSIELGDKYGHEIIIDTLTQFFDLPLKGRWIINYSPETENSTGVLEAFFVTHEISRQTLPDFYSRMIQYSDCMVDTSAQIFHPSALHSIGEFAPLRDSSKVHKFIGYVHKKTGEPIYKSGFTKRQQEKFWNDHQLWDSLRISRTDEMRKTDATFNRMLAEAIEDAVAKGGSNNEFEEYVGRYHSAKTELELKRNRIVVGACSQDQSPRVHAFQIAILSAQTTNWEIFLRSHLNIMNDRFSRMSDGSYALARRETYIKELEVLDINVLDLMLGISLRVGNASENHYYGSINRLGRALSETSQNQEIESRMLQMISDAQLDDYNRVLMYYLFANYNYHLDDEFRKKINQKSLMAAVQKMPKYLSEKIRIDE